MAYRVRLGKVTFPVGPSKIETQVKNQNKTVTLINGDEVNIIQSPGLSDFSFELLLPNVKYPFAQYKATPGDEAHREDTFIPASHYLDYLEYYKNRKKPIRFKCKRDRAAGNHLRSINRLVTLESYKILEDASNGPDTVVSISLKIYKPRGAKLVQVIDVQDDSAEIVEEEVRPNENAPELKTYTVKAGDSLWNISKQYLGNGARYPEIFEMNRDKIENPSLIFPGQVLNMPS